MVDKVEYGEVRVDYAVGAHFLPKTIYVFILIYKYVYLCAFFMHMGVVLNYCSHKGLLGRACANLARFLRDHTPGSLSSFQLFFSIILVLVFEC